jgi:hypothetical protein
LTKTDWSIWSATLANNQTDFESIISPIYDYLNHTTTRDPIADSYMTDDIHSGGMHARPVVGGFFIKMLTDGPIWHKWASADTSNAGNWAPLPKPPTITVIVPAADKQSAIWSYTTTRPAADWTSPQFDDSNWKRGRSGFGTVGTPGAVVGTTWSTDDIWIRRVIIVPVQEYDELQGWLHHDEDVEVYINGVLAVQASGFISGYDTFPLNPEGKAAIKPGENQVAIHCHQTVGGQYVDFGLVDVKDN